MKLRSAFVGLILLAALAACDTNQIATPVSTSVSVGSNPTTAVDNQPTTAQVANNTPASNPANNATPHVVSKSTRPAKTTPTFVFMPRRGGPDVGVSITGGNFTPGQTVVIRIGIPQPIGEALATATAGDDGRWNTLIKIPGTEPSGKAITTTNMQIVVMDQNNQVIVSEPFAFMPK